MISSSIYYFLSVITTGTNFVAAVLILAYFSGNTVNPSRSGVDPFVLILFFALLIPAIIIAAFISYLIMSFYASKVGKSKLAVNHPTRKYLLSLIITLLIAIAWWSI